MPTGCAISRSREGKSEWSHAGWGQQATLCPMPLKRSPAPTTRSASLRHNYPGAWLLRQVKAVLATAILHCDSEFSANREGNYAGTYKQEGDIDDPPGCDAAGRRQQQHAGTGGR